MEQENLFDLIHSIELISNEHIVRFTSQFSYPIGISAILVLAELRLRGPLRASELADMLGYTKGAVTHISTKLVTQELAERQYTEEDRRTVFLKITDKGSTALAEAEKLGQDIYLELFKELTENELEEYLRIQRKMVEGLKNRRLTKPGGSHNR